MNAVRHALHRHGSALLIAATLVALCVAPCYGPALNRYPGLAELERNAEAIAVIEIVSRDKPPRTETSGTAINRTTTDGRPYVISDLDDVCFMDIHEDYRVRIKASLKGPFSEGSLTTMSLRFLTPDDFRTSSSETGNLPSAAFRNFPQGFATKGSCFLVFLEQTTHYAWKPRYWANVDCLGGTMPADCEADNRIRQGESITDAIARITGIR